MKQENDISEELKSMGSPLAGLSRAMPYSIPSGYFEHFATGVGNAVKAINEPEKINDWGKTLPYTVPPGYFEGLTGKIVAAASAENGFINLPLAVPADYFEQLPAQMLLAAKNAEKTKIIPLRTTVLRSLKWAAAAILILSIGFGSYNIIFDQPAGPEKILASVPENEIHEYLQNAYTYKMDVDRVVGSNEVNNLQLDNKDIIQYLNETGWE